VNRWDWIKFAPLVQVLVLNGVCSVVGL